jgi:hypothetical protein
MMIKIGIIIYRFNRFKRSRIIKIISIKIKININKNKFMIFLYDLFYINLKFAKIIFHLK